jgi:hypothetical protein
MDPPFYFGNAVDGQHFTGHQWLMEKVISHLISMKNLVIIAPRGWGKKSFVQEVERRINEREYEYRFCHLDLNRVFTEEAFAEIFLNELSMIPGSPFISDAAKLDHLDDVLDLPEYLAVKNRIKLIIIVGNIQKIAKFKNSYAFQKKLQLHWKLHKNCGYLLWGCKPQATFELLSHPYMPLSGIGRIYNLERPKHDELESYIKRRFSLAGKYIEGQVASTITYVMDRLPFYVQLLGWHCLTRTRHVCSDQIVMDAINHLALQSSLQFAIQTDHLTIHQLGFLKALLENQNALYSRETIKSYHLNSSGNVGRIYKSLTKKEIIINERGETLFLNPIYKYWLREYYFR